MSRRGGSQDNDGKIDISTLYPSTTVKVSPWANPTKLRTLNWTRAQANTAKKEGKFKVVGVEPTRTREDKKSTSKTNIHWSMSKAEEKWQTDSSIVFISDVNPVTLMQAFPGAYTDKTRKDRGAIPLYIAGPKASVIENLVHQLVLPKGTTAKSASDWIEAVGVTNTNYADNVLYKFFVEQDEAKQEEKSVNPDINVGRINELVFLAKTISSKGPSVHIYDVNGSDIGRYGGKLSKNPSNIFTDWLIKKIEKDAADFDEYGIDISKLSSDIVGSSVSKIAIPDVDIAAGQYGTLTKRPIDVEIVFTYKEKEYVIPANTIWTSSRDSISVLFAEIKAVNELPRDQDQPEPPRYRYAGTADAIKGATVALLNTVKERGTKKTKEEQQVDYNAEALYA